MSCLREPKTLLWKWSGADRSNALFYLDIEGKSWTRSELTDYMDRQVRPLLAGIEGVQRVGLEGSPVTGNAGMDRPGPNSRSGNWCRPGNGCDSSQQRYCRHWQK